MINLDRRVVCAANRDRKSGEIILGARHWDSCMRETYQLWVVATNHKTRDMRFVEQGFINTWGEFLTREEAWQVAVHNNQIIKSVGGDMSINGVGRLFSENLY